MIGRFSPVVIALAAVLVAGNVGLDTACQAQAADYYRGPGDLFYNYYVQPGAGGAVPAQLYLSPLPTPPVVGHTYVTYQPLMPHEFLYPHHRRYWRQNPNGGWTRTLVTWQQSFFDFDLLGWADKPIQPPAKGRLDPLLGTARY